MAKLIKTNFLRQLHIAKTVYKQRWVYDKATEAAGLPTPKHGAASGWLGGFLVACVNPDKNDAKNDAFDIFMLAELAYEKYCAMPDEMTDAAWRDYEESTWKA